jgi:hypothetical protein
MSDERPEHTIEPRPQPDPQPERTRREPDNSTVDDWFGQSVERDAELADELVDEAGGDEDEARRRFEEEATGREEQEARHDGRGPGS